MNPLSFKMVRMTGILLIALVALAACAPATTPAAAPPAQAPAYGPAASAAQATGTTSSGTKVSAVEFRNTMRKLWEDHITWTRLYIISVAHNLPDQDATAQRLLANQDDIGNAIKPFYGDAAGNKLTELLRGHILGAADLLAAAKAGDKAKVDAASAKWYQNADDIATFLSNANEKNWPLPTMKEAMKVHLDQTLKEAVDRLGGKYADDIKDYDAVHAHILDMADTLSNGIIAQFPDKFQ